MNGRDQAVEAENIVIARCAPGNETFTHAPVLSRKTSRAKEMGTIFILLFGDRIFSRRNFNDDRWIDDSTVDLFEYTII